MELDGQIVVFETRKALAILVYLALSPQPVSRELLASLFWPEFSQSQALSNLRRNMNSLGNSLKGKVLTSDRWSVWFKDQVIISTDIQDFRRKVHAIQDHSHDRMETCEECLLSLEAAIQAYRGEFLEGLNLRDCPEFDTWQYQLRQALQQELRQALGSHIKQCVARRRWEKAILSAQRLVALDCLEETSHRTMMWLYAQNNQRMAALHQYKECLQILKKELDQDPEPETIELYQNIRDGNPIEYTEMDALLTRSSSSNKLLEPIPSSKQQGSQLIDTILRTKLFIPPVRKDAVKRPRLLAKIDQGIQGALTLVSAPAGFGKTTLLANWAAHSTSPVGWLSLDTDDNDPIRFVSYLIMGLKSIRPEIGDFSLEMLASLTPLSAQTILTPLLNEISRCETRFVLVFDDYQCITAHEINDTVIYLLNHIPANMRLIIASRVDPTLPTARLRATGNLTEIRSSDLRFTQAEAEEFFDEVMHLNLSQEEEITLEERTEGWIAGMQMAALCLQDCHDSALFIRSFSGSNRYILDYLVEEVLARQPEHVQAFLLTTSILNRVCASLADRLDWQHISIENRISHSGQFSSEGMIPITQLKTSQQILEYLERGNIFTISLDEERCWFRYHHLLTQLLRSRAGYMLEDSDTKVLHQRAASWYSDNEMVEEAIYHGFATKDYWYVARLIEQHMQTMLAHGEYELVLKWINSLPLEVIDSRPWLQTNHARILGIFNRTQEMEPILQRLTQQVQQNPDSDEFKKIKAHISYLRAVIAVKEADLDRALNYITQAQEQAEGEDPEFINNLLLLLGSTHLALGNLQEAYRAFSEVIKSLPTVRSLYALLPVFSAMVSLADVHVIRGELNKAEIAYHQARKIAVQWGDAKFHILGRVFISLGNLLYQCNDLLGAIDFTQKGIDHYQQWGHASDMANGYASLARALQASGDISGAKDAMTQALEEANQPTAGSKAFRYVKSQQFQLLVKNEDIEQIAQWLRVNDLNQDEPMIFNNEQNYILRSRILITKNEYKAAINLLKSLANDAQASGRNGSWIEILVLQALALQSENQTNKALQVLMKALKIAEPEGYVRVFVDEGEIMRTLLQKLSLEIETGNFHVKNHERLFEYIRDLLASFSLPADQTSKVAVNSQYALVERLTNRELEILGLLCAGLSNREIAGKLVISNSTAKSHIHHIFSKIGVESRTQLIVRAKELNLV